MLSQKWKPLLKVCLKRKNQKDIVAIAFSSRSGKVFSKKRQVTFGSLFSSLAVLFSEVAEGLGGTKRFLWDTKELLKADDSLATKC